MFGYIAYLMREVKLKNITFGMWFAGKYLLSLTWLLIENEKMEFYKNKYEKTSQIIVANINYRDIIKV